MKKFYGWLFCEVPDGLEAAKGIENGIILGIICWIIIILSFYAVYLIIC